MRLVLVALLALVWAGAADARRTPAKAKRAPDKAAQKAARHFAAAERAEGRKDYETAIREYQKAYKLKPHAAVLYNIAADYQALSDWGQAAEYYRRYLEETVDPQDRAEVEALLDSLQETAGKALMDQALAAKGGQARLEGLKNIGYVLTVTVDDGRQRFAEFSYVRTHDARSSTLTMSGVAGDTVEVVTAEIGWKRNLDGHVDEMSAKEHADALDQMWRDADFIVLRHLEPGTRVRALGKESAFDKEYDAVELARTDGSARTKLLIDPVSHLVFRVEFDSDATVEQDEFDGYRDVGGVLVAYKQSGRRAGTTLTAIAKAVTVDQTLAEDAFKAPRELPELPETKGKRP